MQSMMKPQASGYTLFSVASGVSAHTGLYTVGMFEKFHLAMKSGRSLS